MRSAMCKSAVSRTIWFAVAVLILGACNTTESINPLAGVEFREKRFEQMSRLQAFESCRKHALQLDADARSRGNPGAFLTSAKVLQKCNTDLGAASDAVPANERMRLHALSVVNYMKGGDLELTRQRFDSFKATWPDDDLYFAGGASFIATMDALLGRSEPQSFGRFLALNITGEVKSEMRRINHWKNK